MPLPAEAESIGRAAQLITYWADKDMKPMFAVLSKISTLDEAKDIIVALTIMSDKNLCAEDLEGIVAAAAYGRRPIFQ
jgi:hypothetical protein